MPREARDGPAGPVAPGGRGSPSARGIVLLGVLSVFWGINWPAMKLALTELRPWTFRTLCLVVGGVGLLSIAKASGHPLTISRRDRWPICIAAFFNITTWHILSAYGLTLISAGRAVIIAYTMPLWAVILGRVVLRERLTRARQVALLLGLAGLAMLIGPEWRTLRTAPVGAFFMLGAAICWATGTVLLKYFQWTMPVILLTGWQVMLGAVPVVLGTFLIEPLPSFADLSLKGAMGTAYAAFVGVTLCHYAWFRLVGILPSAIAAIGTLGIPVVGVLSSGLVLAEPVGFAEVAALVLVVCALGIVFLSPRAS